MTPEAYQQEVLPKITSALKGTCICQHKNLRKIMSFNYEDYKMPAVGLADCEILIQALLRDADEAYEVVQDTEKDQYGFRCNICHTFLAQHYDDYSIHMYRAYIEWPEKDDRQGYYMTGFYGLDVSGCEKVDDFVQLDDRDAYIAKVLEK